MISNKMITEEFEEKARKRIDQLLSEKRFDEAAELAVRMAFLHIKPEELVQLLLNAVKEWKSKHPQKEPTATELPDEWEPPYKQ